MSALAKPVLRGHLNKQIAKNLVVATILTVIGGGAFKIFYADPHKKKYADFYKTYDAEAEFQRMKNLGLFKSCQPGDP